MIKSIVIFLLLFLSVPLMTQAVLMVDESTAPREVRESQRAQEEATFSIQSTTTEENVERVDSVDATIALAESLALELPPDTSSWISDLIELFKRAVVVLGDVMRLVIEDVRDAFRSAGQTT